MFILLEPTEVKSWSKANFKKKIKHLTLGEELLNKFRPTF